MSTKEVKETVKKETAKKTTKKSTKKIEEVKQDKKYVLEQLEHDIVKLTFTVDSEDWKKANMNSYNKNKSKYRVDGFRPGKAPKHVIERVYGAVFLDDAIDEVASKYYSDALDNEPTLDVVDSPKNFDVITITADDFKFSVEVQCKPTVVLGKYTGLDFKKESVKVTKEEIKAEVNKAIEQAGAWETVTDRPCQNNDKVLIDYSGSIDGVKFPGGTAEKQDLLLGSNTFIPGFEDQVCGMKVGESKDITVKFPEDYGAKELAGKEAVFAILLHEITVKVNPSYDDEFVKDVSECNTVKEYEESIKKNLENAKEAEANKKLETEMMEKISAGCKVDIPDCMIKREAENMVQEFEYGLMYRGMNKDDYYKYTNSTREDLMKKYEDTAKKNVLIGLVIEAIKKEVEIPVSDADVEEYIEKMAENAKMSADEFKKNINNEYMNYIRNDVATTKLFEFLKNNNNIK